MKRIVCLVVLIMLFTSTTQAWAKPSKCTSGHTHRYHSSSSNNHRTIVKTDYISDEHNFKNCKEHILLSDTIVTFYSDGTKRSYTKYTIKNTDGTILEEDCFNVKHLIYDNKHYFLFKKNKKYNIMDEEGTIISSKKYKILEEIAPNRILTSLEKKYGVIDINENVIIPIKYKSFEKVGKDLYITKLNGYYGMMNSQNDTFIKNEYDKIKPVYDAFILKKLGKYGLADKNGKIIYTAKYDKIKTLGEYFLIKENKRYGILNASGEKITEIKYKEIKLNRNQLEAKTEKNKWIKIGEEV